MHTSRTRASCRAIWSGAPKKKELEINNTHTREVYHYKYIKIGRKKEGGNQQHNTHAKYTIINT